MNKTLKNLPYIILAISLSIFFLLAFGIPTNLVPNPWFTRMIPATPIDSVFLYIEAALLGTYVTLSVWQKKKGITGKCAVAGGFLGFLAFACPICNKLLVFLFGVGFLMSYLQPIRPYLGFIGIALMSFALHQKLKLIRSVQPAQ